MGPDGQAMRQRHLRWEEGPRTFLFTPLPTATPPLSLELPTLPQLLLSVLHSSTSKYFLLASLPSLTGASASRCPGVPREAWPERGCEGLTGVCRRSRDEESRLTGQFYDLCPRPSWLP